MKFHEAAAQSLYACGIEVMFGVVGDGNMYIANSFATETEGRFIASTHEAGAVQMACGYHGSSSKIAAATVTHGAISNTITGLIEASRGRYPLLLVAADTPLTRQHHLQNVPQGQLVAPTGAGFVQVRSPETIAADVHYAIDRARLERRPYVLNVPADYQWLDVEYTAPAALTDVDFDVTPSRSAVEEAVGVIAGSKRPVVLAGHGVASEDARSVIVELAERLGAPLATTLRAKDLFKGHPLNIGIIGTLSSTRALDAMSASDCVISFGAGLNIMTTDNGTLTNGKMVIQCDLDVAAFGRYEHPNIAILGDCARTASLMLELINEAELPTQSFQVKKAPEAQLDSSPTTPHRPGTVDLIAALNEVNRIVPEDRTFVSDGGRFVDLGWRLVDANRERSYVHAVNSASIGHGVGFGIGAAVGSPDHPVLVVSGDGGFMLGSVAELTTACRYELDLIVVIVNDGSYGAEYHRFVSRGLDPGLVMFDWPDFGHLASALGGHGIVVRSMEDFDGVRDAIASKQRPLLIDIRADPAGIPEPPSL